MSVVKEITKVKEISGTDLLKVKVEEETGAITESYWFYNYADAITYLDKKVIVDYRSEMIDGVVVQAINTFTVPVAINTLSKDTNIKLYSDAEDNFATVSFRDLADGEVVPNCIVYCVKQELKSSPKASWLEFIIRDRFMHVATLRLFDYDNTNGDMTGSYIVTALEKSKYGFQTDYVGKANGEVRVNPEITIAKEYIFNYFANDPEALSVIEKFKLMEHFDQLVDYETGYGVVRLATELSLAEQLCNITDAVNITAIKQALLCSHLCITQPNSILSDTVRNCMLIVKTNFPDKKLICQLLDLPTENDPKEREVFEKIKELSDTLMKVRKGDY